MNPIKLQKVLQLNLYSWFLIIVYLLSAITMEYHSNTAHWEGLYLSSPLIILVIIWSEMTTAIRRSSKSASSIKQKSFNRDLFLITFSFISGTLLSFLCEYKNSDVLGWWPIILYIMAIYGFLFALVFSFAATGLNDHRKYTYCYCLVILLFPLLLRLLHNNGFNLVIGVLLGGHLLFVLGYRFFQPNRKTNSK